MRRDAGGARRTCAHGCRARHRPNTRIDRGAARDSRPTCDERAGRYRAPNYPAYQHAGALTYANDGAYGDA
jgi:hypothetical protein